MDARVVGFVAGLALAVLAVAPHAAYADSPVNFSGDWVARADDGAPNKSADTTNAPSHGGHGGHHGGMGGRSHGGQSATSATAPHATDPNAPTPRVNAQAMIIRQDDDVFDIEVDGQRMAYRFDGKHNYGPQYGGTVSLTWAAPEMVVETHPDAGGSIEERYTLSSDAKTLTLVVRTQRLGETTGHETRRVFTHPDDPTQKAGITLP